MSMPANIIHHKDELRIITQSREKGVRGKKWEVSRKRIQKRNKLYYVHVPNPQDGCILQVSSGKNPKKKEKSI